MPNAANEVRINIDKGIILITEKDENDHYNAVILMPYPIALVGKASNIISVGGLYDLNVSADGECPVNLSVIANGSEVATASYNDAATFRDEFLSLIASL